MTNGNKEERQTMTNITQHSKLSIEQPYK